jgi:hypothetical protein
VSIEVSADDRRISPPPQPQPLTEQNESSSHMAASAVPPKYRVVQIQSEAPRRPFNGLNSRTVIRTHQSANRLPILTATMHAESARVGRDRVGTAQLREWRPGEAKPLPSCRYAKPLCNTFTPGRPIGNFNPEPIARVVKRSAAVEYTLNLDCRAQARDALVVHLAPGHQKPTGRSFRMADRGRQKYSSRHHADIVRMLEALRTHPGPMLFTVGALLLGSPLQEFIGWLQAAVVVLPGIPLQAVPEMAVYKCPPASAIANGGDTPTRIQLNATTLRFDYRRQVSLQRWIASGETRSWLTLGAVASTHDGETRFMGLGKTFMSWEQEDRTDGPKDEPLPSLEFERSCESVAIARVKPRRRELQRRLSSHGDRRVLADVGFAYLRGMTQTEIAAKLGVDLATVRRYISWCHSKLGWLCFYRGASQEIIFASVQSEQSPSNNLSAWNHLEVPTKTALEIRTLITEKVGIMTVAQDLTRAYFINSASG